MSALYGAVNLGAAADAERFAAAFADRWDPAVDIGAGDVVAASPHLLTVCRASAYVECGGLRPPRVWDPVVVADARRLRPDGAIPGDAVERVYTVPEVMATLHAADPAFIDELARTVLSPSGTFLSLCDEVLCAAAPGLLRALSRWWLASA